MKDEVRSVVVDVSDDILHQAMSDIYNSGQFEMIAQDGTRVFLVDKDTDQCEECRYRIPVVDGGSLENQHHAEGCSLYAATRS